ncbi:MAG: GPW/gp25 family protein [Bacteroidales bacterium]|nr:GPW/gp25 family protein [Bacteroidales bacterium]
MKKSVDEHIELIIMTHMGEYKHDKDFGFVLWEREFVNIEIEKFNTHNNPKQDIETNLKNTLAKFEPRLKNINVDILFIYKKTFRGKKIKYFVNITVKGILVNMMEHDYEKSFQFAMGPLYK